MMDGILKPDRFFASQEVDCCESGISNEIVVEICDGGGGPYLVIKTDRWALSDAKEIDAFARELKACLKKAE